MINKIKKYWNRILFFWRKYILRKTEWWLTGVIDCKMFRNPPSCKEMVDVTVNLANPGANDLTSDEDHAPEVVA